MVGVFYNSTYFVKSQTNAKHKFIEDGFVNMIHCLIDNFFVECGGAIFLQVVDFPMGTLLDDLFVSSTRVELAWHSGSVMDCHATARGSIPAGNGIFTELHVLRKEQ